MTSSFCSMIKPRCCSEAQITQSGNGHLLAYTRVKSAQAVEGGGCTPSRPPPFTISTITYKVVVCAPAEREDTPPVFLFYRFMYSVL